MLELAQGKAQPLSEQSSAHRRTRAVDGAEQRPLGSAAANGSVDLQAPVAARIDRQVILDDMALGDSDVREGRFLGFFQIREHRADGENCCIILRKPEAFSGSELPLPLE